MHEPKPKTCSFKRTTLVIAVALGLCYCTEQCWWSACISSVPLCQHPTWFGASSSSDTNTFSLRGLANKSDSSNVLQWQMPRPVESRSSWQPERPFKGHLWLFSFWSMMCVTAQSPKLFLLPLSIVFGIYLNGLSVNARLHISIVSMHHTSLVVIQDYCFSCPHQSLAWHTAGVVQNWVCANYYPL